MNNLRSLEFDAFPAEIRLKIYRKLLINKYEHKMDPVEMIGNRTELHPQILRCSKKTHDEVG